MSNIIPRSIERLEIITLRFYWYRESDRCTFRQNPKVLFLVITFVDCGNLYSTLEISPMYTKQQRFDYITNLPAIICISCLAIEFTLRIIYPLERNAADDTFDMKTSL